MIESIMLACHLAGNPAGIEAAMDELCAVVETLEPYDSLQPETLALYDGPLAPAMRA